ncbi:MAG: COG3014 family protein [Nitrospinota bacterium]
MCAKIRFPLFLSGALLLLSSCAGGLDYRTLNNYMVANSCTKAAEFVEGQRSSYGINGKLLYLLDSGMVNFLCGQHEKSNRFFHEAEELAEKLWTKSVSREMASYLVNDYTRAYSGEDFEKALINLFSALNYVMLGQTDEALVEFRRLDANLSMFNQKYKTKNVYKEDAFGRYLSGMVYEAAGEFDDAYIDYFNSYKIYRGYSRDYGTPTPSQLSQDLVRLAVKTQREDDLPAPLKGKKRPGFSGQRKMGRIVVIHLNGKSPVKSEEKISIPSSSGPITLAFPKYEKRRPSCRKSFLSVQASDGTRPQTKKFELGEDINEIAVKNLKDRRGRVIAKTVARAVAKQVVINSATEDKMARVLFNIANSVIERADTRTWRTLPGEIAVGRVFVKPGQYEVSVSACDRPKKRLGDPEIRAGETRFFIFNTMF